MAIDLKNISEYFQYPSKVTELRGRLYNILRDKGIEVTADESLNSLIEKVRTVEPAILPQTIYITENNTTYDVTEYTDAVVNVPVETIENDLDGLVDGSLKSFTMPSQISTLAHRRFYDFINLSFVSMPQVTGIPENTFYNCVKLSEINIPEATYIDGNAFCNCYTLNNIESPKVVSLGGSAFRNCYNLKQFSNSNIDTIQYDTFGSNYALSYLSLPNVKEIFGTPFKDCYNLSELSLPNLVRINNEAFASTQNLSKLQNVNLPKLTITSSPLPYNQLNTILNLSNLESISINTASYFIDTYPNLNSLNLDNLSFIQGGLVRSCGNITSIVLPNLVSVANGSALVSDLSNLSYLEIKNLSNVGANYLIHNCPNLAEINIPNWNSNIFLSGTKISQLIVPKASGIGYNGLFGCENLEYIDITNASYLGESALNGCTNLSKIDAYNLTDIRTFAFNNCINLESITLCPKYSTNASYTFKLSDYAFNGCKKLSAVYLQTSIVYNFNENVFNDTPILNSDYLGYYGSIYVQSSILSDYISRYSSTRLVSRFASFSEEYMQDNILAEQFRFQNTMTEIPESMLNAKIINARAFSDCSQLASISLPMAEKIQEGAFYAYSYNKSVNLPECTYIGPYAFYLNRSYNTYSINIPKCKTIGNSAFQVYYSYNTLYLNCPEIETIGNYGIYYHSSVYFSNSTFSKLKSIGIYGLGSHYYVKFSSNYISFPELSFLGEYALYYNRYMSGYNSSTNTYGSLTLDFPKLETINRYAFANLYDSISILVSSAKTIHEGAFQECYVSDIGNTYNLEYIGTSAFYRCYYLSTIFSSPKLRYLGDYAFRECGSLTTVNFPECLWVGYNCFYADTNLREVYLPKIATLRTSLFYACKNLSSLTLDFSRITSINENCFYNCESLTELSFPNVSYISNSAFRACYNLSSLTLGNITSLPQYAFTYCSKLQFDNINLSGLKSVSVMAFAGCLSLSEFSNEHLVSLPNGIFSNCSRLSVAYLPGVRYLETAVFSGCYNLSELTLDFSNLTSINAAAFYTCSSLSNFETSPYLKSIGQSAFVGCTGLTEFSLQNLSIVAAYTFSACTNLSSVDLGNIESVYTYAFNGNYNLEYIGDTSKLKYIGNVGFGYCSKLSSINLNNIEYLGNDAFAGCTELNIPLPSLSRIPDNCFFQTGLTSIDNSTVVSVGVQAFNSCISLSTVNLYNTEYIGSAAFSGCRSLTSFTAPNLNSISTYALAGTRLSQIPNDVANNISNYPYGLFMYCYNMLSIDNIPNLKSLGGWTFAYCSNLSYVRLSGCNYLSTNEFKNCSNLETVDLPQITNLSSGYIYTGNYFYWSNSDKSIFSGCSNLKYVNLPNCSQLYRNISSPMLTSVNLSKLEILDTDTFTDKLYLESVNLNNLQRLNINNGLSGCQALQSINLPKIRELTYGTFYRCFSLNNISIPNLIKANGYAFRSCSSLVTIDAKYLCNGGDSTFLGCINLEEINAPVVEPIYNETFNNCNKLKSIKINCNSIYNYTFSNCNSLSEMYILNAQQFVFTDYFLNCLGTTPFAKSSYLGYYGSIYVPSNMLSIYQTNYRTSSYSERFVALPESFKSTYLYGSEFANKTISASNIRSDIKYILNGALFNTSLSGDTSLVFNNAKFIGSSAFYACNLTSISLPQVEGIFYGAFSGCQRLTELNASNCKYIDEYAFANCKVLSSLSLPNVDTIKAYAFANCTNLSELHLNNTIIDSYAFAGCSNLEVIDLPNCYSLGYGNFNGYSRSHIGKVRYLNMPKLSIFTCPGNSTSYGMFASSTFSNNIDYINIGCSDFNIYTYMLTGKSITSMVMSNISRITFSMFSGCTIESLELPKCNYISGYTFNSAKIGSLTLSSLVGIGEGAFNGASIPNLNLVVNTVTLPRYAFTAARLSTVRFTELVGTVDYYANFERLSTKTLIFDKYSQPTGQSFIGNCSIENIVFNSSAISLNAVPTFGSNTKLRRVVFQGDLISYAGGWGSNYLFSNTPIDTSTYLSTGYGSIYVHRSYFANWYNKLSYYGARITTIEEHIDELRNEGLID